MSATIVLGVLAGSAVTGPTASATNTSWAAGAIAQVTRVGVLGATTSSFRADAPLTQGALAAAIAATDRVQHPPSPPPVPAPLEVTSTIPAGGTIAGLVSWEVDAPGREIGSVDFAVDGVGRATADAAPWDLPGGLDTHQLTDGQHQLAVNVHFVGGGYAIAVWTVAVGNGTGGDTGTGPPTDVPVVKSWLPPPPSPPVRQHGVLYVASSATLPVTIKQLDAALVTYLGLAGAAREIQQQLVAARLHPPPNTGTEVAARLLGLRIDHPAKADDLERLPNQAASRAEAAWSFARVLHVDSWAIQYVEQVSAQFGLPNLTNWQRRVLTTAVSYVGYPYVWGGTSPSHEVDFGVPAAGGFDCSGFVWRVYKLTPYPSERGLADVLRGRTTFVMSGEVPRHRLVPAGRLRPADVMFFGDKGPHSSPSIVDHTALYLGGGWLIQSSSEGVTLQPFDGWYRHEFAWARRPLHEAGLE